MKENRFRYGALLIVLFNFFLLNAQYQDFRTWWDVNLSGDITKELEANIELGQRFRENSLLYDRSLATLSFDYNLAGNLKAGIGGRYVIVRDKGSMESRYRVNADISYAMNPFSLTIDFRERIQNGFDDLQSLNDYLEQNIISRTRVKLSYPIYGTPLNAHAAFEYFLDLHSGIGILPVAYRGKLGLEYAVTPKSELDLSYMFENEINTINPLFSSIIQVSFGYKIL